MTLSLAEATLLKRALDDPDVKRAVAIFFNNQREYYSEKCKDEMLSGNKDKAEQYAWFAKAHETCMPELMHFVDNQLGRI